MYKMPLAKKLRPQTLDQIIGQSHLLTPGKPFRKLIESDKLRSFILFGPPGTGKTTIAEVIAHTTQSKFIRINATNATVKDIRKVADSAVEADEQIVLFVDEIHRFSKTQQDVLLPYVEDGNIIFIGATTENPYHSINSPLISRSQIFKLEPLNSVELATIFKNGIEYLRKTTEKALDIDPEAIKWAIKMSCGDGRKILGLLDLVSEITDGQITVEHMKLISPNKYMIYDDNEHFNLASAFQGSIQASDPNSAVYWLAKWLESGEDPRYIARRLLVSAAEDAYSNPVCTAVAHAAYVAACEIGRPECDILMSQATLLIASSKRDKTAACAIWEAVRDVKSGFNISVPDALKDCHYPGAKEMGEGLYKDGKHQEFYVKGVDKQYFRPGDWK